MSDSEEEQAASRLFAFQAVLDGSRHASEPVVDMDRLRDLCSTGIPHHPPHLRPLAYSLLLRVLPVEKSSWRPTFKTQRLHYYGLVKTHMEALEAVSDGPGPTDKLLQQISRDLLTAQSRFTILKHQSFTPSSSPLAPPTEPELEDEDLGDNDFDDYISSSSSEDEPEDSEQAARAREPRPKQQLSQMRLLCRRAAFKRLELIAQADHHAEAQKRQSTDSSTSQTVLSPRITLSTDNSRSQSPLETPQLSLSVPEPDDGTSDQASPITLLPSRPIPSGSFLQSGSMLAGALLTPDTHGETICRLLYIFTQANPQWQYHQGLIDIVCHLYSTYSQIEWVSRKRRAQKVREPVPRGKWAEEQTYWAFCALMREYESVIAPTPSSPPADINIALDCLSRRLKYADEPLWSILHANGLDPAQPTYASRWISLLLTRDLPLPYLAPVWDYFLSSPPNPEDRIDDLVDICVAMITLARPALLGEYARKRTTAGPAPRLPPRGMWSGTDQEEAMSVTYDEEKQLQILRAVPLDRLCEPVSVLHVATELFKERMQSGVKGLGLRDEAQQPVSIWQSLAQGGKYVQSYADPKTVASITDTSAKWGSAAVAGVFGATKRVSTMAGTVKTEGAPAAVGGLWSSLRSWAAPAPLATPAPATSTPTQTPPQDDDDVFTPLSLTPDRRGSVQSASSAQGTRERSDSIASGYSVASLQERLAGITGLSSPSGSRTPPRAPAVQGPRPLLLGKSARRVSTSSDRERDSRRDSKDSDQLTPGSHLASPPVIADNAGFYRIGSRHGAAVRTKPTEDKASPEI